MLYCEKCNRLNLRAPCYFCGRKRLRPVEPTDPVLLMELGAMDAMMVEPLLSEADIPYYRDGRLGSALAAALGAGLETYRLYVSSEKREEAVALIVGTFGEDAEILRCLIPLPEQA